MNSTAIAHPETTLQQAQNRVNTAIDELHAVVAGLRHRLKPVMLERPRNDSQGDGTTAKPLHCQAITSLDEQYERLQQLHFAITELMHDIDL